MPTFSEGAVRRIALGSGHWGWPAGLVALYAAPALLAWRTTILPPKAAALSSVLAIALMVLSEIDRKSFRLPDLITIPLALTGILAAAILDSGVMWHAFSAGLGLALILLVDRAYRAWRGVSGIGLGDAKLFAASGAWLGAEAFLTVLLWTCASALAVLVLARAFGRQVDAQTAIPFGSFLAFGTWLVWCLGPLH